MEITNRMGDEDQPLWIPKPAESMFDLLHRMQAQLSVQLYKAVIKSSGTH